MNMSTPSSPGRLPGFLARVADHNPFYLLSALCMVAGCWVLSHALRIQPGSTESLTREVLLAATLQGYEAALVGLAVVLVRRGNVARDARMLLLIEALFIADVTYTNATCYMAGLGIGVAVNLAVLALALAKLWIIQRALGIARRPAGWAFLIFQLSALLGLPGVFAALARATPLPGLVVYAGWWLLGLAWVLRPARGAVPAGGRTGPTPEPLVAGALDLLPMASLAAHLVVANWVHSVPFHLANVAPLLLGVAVAAARARWPRHEEFHFALPTAAILLSTVFPHELEFTWGGANGLTVTPFRMVLVAAALVYAHGFVLHRQARFAWAAAAGVLVAAAGGSVGEALATVAGLFSGGRAALSRLIPETAWQWGVAAVTAAFAFLGAGAAVSLWKSRRAAGRAE